ncbi:MAG: hypothetical protein U0237_09135 [Thermoleophilia bacterium]
MTGRSLAAAVALLAVPAAAVAAPQRPATVGDNRVDDRGASSFVVAAGTGALVPFTGTALLDAAGAELWTAAGVAAPHPGGGAVVLTAAGPYRVSAAGALTRIADRPAAPRDGGGVLVESDGRIVVTDGATVTMLAADGTVLWTAPGGGELVRGPAHLYAGTRILDPATGATVGTLPEGRVRVAPDGTLRVLGGGTLTAATAAGAVLWTYAVTPAAPPGTRSGPTGRPTSRRGPPPPGRARSSRWTPPGPSAGGPPWCGAPPAPRSTATGTSGWAWWTAGWRASPPRGRGRGRCRRAGTG